MRWSDIINGTTILGGLAVLAWRMGTIGMAIYAAALYLLWKSSRPKE